MAAQRTSANTDSSHQFRLVAHTDLPQLDPCAEHACQILHQLSEVDSSIRRKIEQYLVVVKSILGIDQFHLQSVTADLLLTDLKCLPLFDLIIGLLLRIPLCGYAQHRFQGLYHLGIVHLRHTGHHQPILDSSGRLYNNMVSSLDLILQRIKIIHLPCGPKSYTNYFCHFSDYLSASVFRGKPVNLFTSQAPCKDADSYILT